MVDQFKENVKEAADKRKLLTDQLESGITFHDGSSTDGVQDDPIHHIVYDLCGYLLFVRKRFFKCDDCLVTVKTDEHLLPAEFYADSLTALKNLGGLKFCTQII
jgi:hypothetical protein